MLKSLIILCFVGVNMAGQGGYRYLNVGPKTNAPLQHNSLASFAAPHTEYEKHFYYFNAPEEQFDQSEELKRVLQTQVKRNLQVIFIKTPENKAYERAALNLARQAVDQQTHIYLLSKQPDYAGLARRVQQVQQATRTQHKPQVHFVKYHTPAQAQHAQQSITQQYEALGGQSAHFNLGAAQPHAIYTRSQLLPAASTLQTTNAENDTPVDKSYAQNFLPGGADVVPGSSYIPLALRN